MLIKEKNISTIETMLGYRIFNAIQDLKNVYFNSKLNSREVMSELERVEFSPSMQEVNTRVVD